MTEISHETLLESLFDGVYYVDLDLRIVVWNKGAERITGYTKGEGPSVSAVPGIFSAMSMMPGRNSVSKGVR